MPTPAWCSSGLACLSSAGFRALLALATPGVLLLDHRSVGFVIATLGRRPRSSPPASLPPRRSTSTRAQRRDRDPAPARVTTGPGVALVVGAAVISADRGHAARARDRPRRAPRAGSGNRLLQSSPLYAVARPVSLPSAALRRRPSRLLVTRSRARGSCSPKRWLPWRQETELVRIVVGVAPRSSRLPSSSSRFGPRSPSIDAPHRPSAPFTNLYLEHTLARVDSRFAEALKQLIAVRACGALTGCGR